MIRKQPLKAADETIAHFLFSYDFRHLKKSNVLLHVPKMLPLLATCVASNLFCEENNVSTRIHPITGYSLQRLLSYRKKINRGKGMSSDV